MIGKKCQICVDKTLPKRSGELGDRIKNIKYVKTIKTIVITKEKAQLSIRFMNLLLLGLKDDMYSAKNIKEKVSLGKENIFMCIF